MVRTADGAKDQELLALLSANARMPLSEIAKQLGVSRATIQARVARLEREGAIGGYTILRGKPAPEASGLSAIVLIEIDVRSQTQVISALKRLPAVVSCHTMSGQYDLFARIRCKLPSELDETIDRIASFDGVRRTMSSLLLSQKFER
jgi:DNA-binding Lrp family transcriptional regulator